MFGGVAWLGHNQYTQGVPYLGIYSIYCPKGEPAINLRKQPNLSKNVIIQAIKCGDSVEVTGGPHQADNETWLPVIFKLQTGFIAKKHLVKKANVQK
jgi:hypothetical protein